MEQEKNFVAAVLKVLERKNEEPTKVLIQKFIYFLNTQGINTYCRFEPYTYGPYSFQLASTLGSMNFWDEIKEEKEKISIINLNSYNCEKSLMDLLSKKFDIFKKAVGDLSFANLECFGTALYCANVLKNYGDELTEEAIKTEFKAWKKNRYNDAAIHNTYLKIKDFIYPQLNK